MDENERRHSRGLLTCWNRLVLMKKLVGLEAEELSFAVSAA